MVSSFFFCFFASLSLTVLPLQSWMTNTCAIRTTMALRGLGIEAGDAMHTKWRDGKRRRYLIRVLEMEQYMRTVFGKPDWVGGAGIKVGHDRYEMPREVRGKAGVIRYSDCPWQDATGHFDVWNGEKDKGHGYPFKCNLKEVWNVCKPRREPDVEKLRDYAKRTNAYDTRTTPGAAAPSGNAVRSVQKALSELSARINVDELNPGPVDGLMGSKTRDAIKEFERIAGLPVTGVPTEELVAKIEAHRPIRR